MHDFRNDKRFADIEPFKTKVWLSSPTMHGDEQRWVTDAFEKTGLRLPGRISMKWNE